MFCRVIIIYEYQCLHTYLWTAVNEQYYFMLHEGVLVIPEVHPSPIFTIQCGNIPPM